MDPEISLSPSLKQPPEQTFIIWETVWDAGNTKKLKILSFREKQFNWKVSTNRMPIYRAFQRKASGSGKGITVFHIRSDLCVGGFGESLTEDSW